MHDNFLQLFYSEFKRIAILPIRMSPVGIFAIHSSNGEWRMKTFFGQRYLKQSQGCSDAQMLNSRWWINNWIEEDLQLNKKKNGKLNEGFYARMHSRPSFRFSFFFARIFQWNAIHLQSSLAKLNEAHAITVSVNDVLSCLRVHF